MSIRIIQTCNGCGQERQLKVGYHGGLKTINDASNVNGWREVTTNRHLCDKCIRLAISDR